MTDPSMAVAWNTDVTARGPAPQGWAPRRSSVPLSALLRLSSGALALLAGVLVALSTLPSLLTLETEFASFELTAWADAASWDLFGSPFVFGWPLVGAAAVLVVAAGLVVVSEWQPRLRGAALAAVVGAVAFASAQLWIIGSYLSDFLREVDAVGAESTDAARGGGYWFLLAGVLVSLVSVVALTSSHLRFQQRVDAARPAAVPAPVPAAAPVSYWEGPR